MKLLMLSTDENVLKNSSEVQGRMIEYGSLFEELHIVVYSKSQSEEKQIAKNVFVYSTNTQFKLFYFWDIYRIARSILRKSDFNREVGLSQDWRITSQDPFEVGLAGYLLKRKFKLPLQMQIHTDFLSPYFWQESLKNKICVLLGKRFIKKADCIRVVSKRIKDSILRKSDLLNIKEVRLPKIDVLPIFVDIEKIKSTPIKTDLHKKYPNYDFIILMASRLTREKNIEMAIDVMAELRRQEICDKRHVLLLIVGDGPERKNLESRIQDLGLENNIKFESWTNDLTSYYKTADVFFNTSNYEGYGRTIIESLAAGCPVISTNVGVAAEFIKSGKSGMVIEPKDARGLSNALIEIMANQGRYKGIIEKSIIKDKNEYLELYKENISKCTITGNSLKKN